MPPQTDPERRPLLSQNSNRRVDSHHDEEEEQETVEFSEDDTEDPRHWALSVKYFQTVQVFILSFVCPIASSMFAPAISDISKEFGSDKQVILLGQTGFVCMLGIGPLFLAPMSETFGRRVIFVTNLAIFTILQIPTAMASNTATFLVMRTLGGFFGSVGVANGGGTVSDMFETRARAPVLGFYQLAPLLGPTIGPLLGSLILAHLDWRWIFWVVFILTGAVTVMCFFFLYETQATTILQQRKSKLQAKHPDRKYKVDGVSNLSILGKVRRNSTRAIRILTTQPVVMIMSLYQALIFSSMYSLYAQYTTIWSSPPYNFDTTQVGLTYLGPATGFIFTAVITVGFIDRLYSWLSKRYDTDGQPEYRLPMANIGALLLPTSLFWFGWALQDKLSWPIPLASTLLFGASQVSIFTAIQTYYIDSFESNAASALAAGAFMRSVVGGIVPLFVGGMFDSLGYGWGMSVFGILSLILMPAPMLFFYYGRRLREKFPFKP